MSAGEGETPLRGAVRRAAILSPVAAVILALGQLWGGQSALSPRQAEILRRVRALTESDPQAGEALLRRELTRARPCAFLLELAHLRNKAGAEKEARALLEEILAKDPAFPGAQKSLAQLLVRAGRYGEAVSLFEKAFLREGTDPASLRFLGRALLELGRYVQAEAALTGALAATPSAAGVLLDCARVHFFLGNYTRCANESAAVLNNDPRNAAAWVLLAKAQLQAGRTKEAAEALEAALRLGCDLPGSALWTLGDVYLRESLFEDAVRLYQTALSREGASAGRLGKAALSLLSAGRLDHAKAYALKALKADPHNTDALCVLGRIYRKEGRLETSEKYLREALKESPTHGEAILSLSQVLRERGRLSEALSWCRTARTIPSFAVPALRFELDLLLGAKRYSEALQVVKLLEELTPRPPSWQELRRALRERLGQEESGR